MNSSQCLLVAVVSVVVCLGSLVEGVAYSNCASGEPRGSLQSIQVSGCTDESDKCFFYRGRNSTIESVFTSNVISERVRVRVWGIIGGVQIPFKIQPDEACGNYGPTCPTAEGAQYPLRISVPILTSYPKVGVKVRIRLDDETRKPFFCRQFPVQITDPEEQPLS